MKKQLIIHIGHYKTGTTALQVFFGRSRQFFEKIGWDYPDVWSHNAKHSAFAFSILKAAGVTKMMYDYADETPPQKMWQDLFDHIAGTGRDVTLISSEEFMRMGQFPDSRRILHDILTNRPAWLQIKVIAFLREPAGHLQSWHNQLIKMNIPVSSFNGAVAGDIEDIHFDYKLALEPWINAVGAGNVLIRPYSFDPKDPGALHRAFMEAFGIQLPEGLARPESDPNPRFDDRIVELVRLMQNLGLPRQTIQTIRTQAVEFLGAQDKLAPKGSGKEGVLHAEHRARDSLNWLAGQPGNTVPTDMYLQSMPHPSSQEEIDRDLLLGFIYAELIHLRQRVNRMGGVDLLKRVERLEQQLAGKS